ncbi:MAG: transketolase [Oscillospiraceae bacterium]
MTKQEKSQLEQTACNVRMGIITGTHAAASGHPGGSLSAADVITYLYKKVMKYDIANPRSETRDRFVLSKGHCAPALYATLAEVGFFDKKELLSLRHIGSFLQGHPNMNTVPGVDMSTGSLGQGISAACGMAKGAKLQNANYRVYTLLGDGEIQEGQVWEAFMFAAHNKLDNLCVVIDNNGLQIDGKVADICSPMPIDEKMQAFGFAVTKIDGNNFDELETAFEFAQQQKGKPTAIIMTTVKGKGVSFMENAVGWHGKAPNDEEYEKAMAELTATKANI